MGKGAGTQPPAPMPPQIMAVAGADSMRRDTGFGVLPWVFFAYASGLMGSVDGAHGASSNDSSNASTDYNSSNSYDGGSYGDSSNASTDYNSSNSYDGGSYGGGSSYESGSSFGGGFE